MSEWLLRGVIEEVRLEFNGEEPAAAKAPRPEPKTAGRDLGTPKNVVIAAMAYPRSGASVVTCLKELDLESGKTFDDFGPNPSFWDNGLFKEVVQGETAMRISVSDRDLRNPFVKFLRRTMGSGLGVLLRGTTGGMLGGMVGNLTKALNDAIVGSEQRVRNLTVATSARAHVVIGEEGAISVPNSGSDEQDRIQFEDGRLRLSFEAPRAFTSTVLEATGGRTPQPREKPVVSAGDPNGYIILRLETVLRAG